MVFPGRAMQKNYRLSMALGSDVQDGRGHVMIAADYNENKGIPLATGRDWALRHPGLLAVGGSPSNIIANNVSLFLASPNGVTLPGGPLGNLEFFAGWDGYSPLSWEYWRRTDGRGKRVVSWG